MDSDIFIAFGMLAKHVERLHDSEELRLLEQKRTISFSFRGKAIDLLVDWAETDLHGHCIIGHALKHAVAKCDPLVKKKWLQILASSRDEGITQKHGAPRGDKLKLVVLSFILAAALCEQSHETPHDFIEAALRLLGNLRWHRLVFKVNRESAAFEFEFSFENKAQEDDHLHIMNHCEECQYNDCAQNARGTQGLFKVIGFLHEHRDSQEMQVHLRGQQTNNHTTYILPFSVHI